MDHGWVIRRHELSHAEWEFVRPLPPVSLRGRKRVDDRKILNGIVRKFRTGTAWRDVPDRYGPWATCTPALAGGRRTAPSSGCSGPPRRRRTQWGMSTGWCRSTPPSSAPPARRRGPKRRPRSPGLGRSRGGLTSKIHLACDAFDRSLAFIVTGGNTNDCTQFTAVMEAIRVPVGDA
ncbi:transposase [Streptomyces kaempferi]|uniref:Transposase n=1 Tax=Streptomyces kaempferi TaxID=333725 RepID=A0ABW3XX72_9ACTN